MVNQPLPTIAQWLVDSMVMLKQAGIEQPRTDCLVLLGDAFQKEKSWLLTHPEHIIEQPILAALQHDLQQRCERTPLAYIRGFKEFYGRNFIVTPDVLIPRPESESFIELLLNLDETSPDAIIDIGTGSGCLGITAALELPDSRILLTDNDAAALHVAQKNTRLLRAPNVDCMQSDLLTAIPAFFGSATTDSQRTTDYIMLANLPYVPETLVTSPEISKEPSVALFSGTDGLQHYQRFWQQVAQLSHKPRYIMTESLEQQHATVVQLAQAAHFELVTSDVLVQVFRCSH